MPEHLILMFASSYLGNFLFINFLLIYSPEFCHCGSFDILYLL
uniref:Uncharacterized protein n=1 Tax=Rhizophora mucronata TaxID=61149 RepID=A0A2P2PSM0_RHIMU